MGFCRKLQLASSKNDKCDFSVEFACGHVVVTSNYRELGGQNRTRILFPEIKNKFRITQGYLTGYLAPTPYTPSVQAKVDFSFYGEMKCYFHRQLPLGFLRVKFTQMAIFVLLSH